MRALLAIATAVLAACGSPEASRTRGGGPGGDIGNRAEILRMHEGSRPYYHTKRRVPHAETPLDTASQAQEFGRR